MADQEQGTPDRQPVVNAVRSYLPGMSTVGVSGWHDITNKVSLFISPMPIHVKHAIMVRNPDDKSSFLFNFDPTLLADQALLVECLGPDIATEILKRVMKL